MAPPYDRSLWDAHRVMIEVIAGLCAGLHRYLQRPIPAAAIYAPRLDAEFYVLDPYNALAHHRAAIRHARDRDWDWPPEDAARTPSQWAHSQSFRRLPWSPLAYGECATSLRRSGETVAGTRQHFLIDLEADGLLRSTLDWWVQLAATYAESRIFAVQTGPGMGGLELARGFHPIEHLAQQSLALVVLTHTKDGGIGEQPAVHQDALDLIGRLSTAVEEGQRHSGALVFASERTAAEFPQVASLSRNTQPRIHEVKRLGKLLAGTRDARDPEVGLLVADGVAVGYVPLGQALPKRALVVRFANGVGRIAVGDRPLARVRDGDFLAHDPPDPLAGLDPALRHVGVVDGTTLPGVLATRIVAEHAARRRHGCTVVIDCRPRPTPLAGHVLDPPPDATALTRNRVLQGLAEIDGAVQITLKGNVVAFGALLDGPQHEHEDLSRGARFNSALRFSHANPGVVIVVCSSDGGATVAAAGRTFPVRAPTRYAVELNEIPTLDDWLDAAAPPMHP